MHARLSVPRHVPCANAQRLLPQNPLIRCQRLLLPLRRSNSCAISPTINASPSQPSNARHSPRWSKTSKPSTFPANTTQPRLPTSTPLLAIGSARLRPSPHSVGKRQASAPLQLDPAPAVQPKQCSPVAIVRPSNVSGESSHRNARPLPARGSLSI